MMVSSHFVSKGCAVVSLVRDFQVVRDCSVLVADLEMPKYHPCDELPVKNIDCVFLFFLLR